MKVRKLTLINLLLPGYAIGSSLACSSSPLSTYLNSGSPYLCSETGGVNIGFNQNLLPAYAGIDLLSSNNTAAAVGAITVAPGASSLSFQSSGFTESSSVLSSQAELVQFNAYSTGTIASTTFQLQNPQVSAGEAGLGTGVVIGQELVCVGGNFTSLPTGLVTSVANGTLGTGYLGCNGTALVGTAATSVGLLSAVTSLVALPPLTGLTDTANIQLSPYSTNNIDVIKTQVLLTTTGGSASTTGFGDTFVTATPEPPGAVSAGLGIVLVALGVSASRKAKRMNGEESSESTCCLVKNLTK